VPGHPDDAFQLRGTPLPVPLLSVCLQTRLSPPSIYFTFDLPLDSLILHEYSSSAHQLDCTCRLFSASCSSDRTGRFGPRSLCKPQAALSSRRITHISETGEYRRVLWRYERSQSVHIRLYQLCKWLLLPAKHSLEVRVRLAAQVRIGFLRRDGTWRSLQACA
jgi:hypothetical protein